MRRTSNSRTIRNPALDRSRTRRSRRSYQPIWTRPQQLQIVFLSADRARRSAHLDHRIRHERLANEYPSDRRRCLLPDSDIAHDAEFQRRSKHAKAHVHRPFHRFDPPKSPTRFPEDPQKECRILEGHLMPDHVHMLISIPPKYAVSHVVGYIRGKAPST